MAQSPISGIIVIVLLGCFLGLIGESEACFCTKVYDPVCGRDGVTYSNQCMLKCAKGVGFKHGGRCEDGKPGHREGRKMGATKSCSCTREFDYTCGTDGVTYSNPCVAECAGAMMAYKGKCATDT